MVVLALLGPGLHADKQRRTAPPPAAEAITKVQVDAGDLPAFYHRRVQASPRHGIRAVGACDNDIVTVTCPVA